MSGTFPAAPVASAIDVRSVSPTRVSIGQSLKRQARSSGAQRWGVSLTWADMLQAAFAPIWAFCIAQRGQFGSFQIVLPPPYNVPQGSWAGGAPLVDGAGQTGRTLNLKGFTPSQAGVVKAGDFFKGADSKIYMATADANSTVAGKVVALPIEPALIVSPADGEAIVYTAVPFTMQLSGDIVAHPVRPPALFTYSLELLEAY